MEYDKQPSHNAEVQALAVAETPLYAEIAHRLVLSCSFVVICQGDGHPTAAQHCSGVTCTLHSSHQHLTAYLCSNTRALAQCSGVRIQQQHGLGVGFQRA